MSLISEILILILLFVAGAAAGIVMNSAFDLSIWFTIPFGWFLVWCAAFSVWATLLFFVDRFIEEPRYRRSAQIRPPDEPSETKPTAVE